MADQVPLLDLVRQYEGIRDEIDTAVREVLASATFIGGSPVRDFEGAFARYVEAAECVGVANGTDAIEIVLEALTLPPESEVVVPANSFIASSEAVTRAGHRVVFADVDEATYVLDPEDVARRITPRTRAILAVHLYGHPAPLDALGTLAVEHGLALIEDAAQAHGARSGGRPVGAVGTAGTFSFYPGKNLGAYGDAGAITTSDRELARRTRMIANHGRVHKYDHEFEGRNSRLDALQAAVLQVKLRHLDRWTERRRALADRYLAGLAGVGDLVLPREVPGVTHVYHLFVTRTARRDALQAHLREAGIETGIHYPIPLPRLGAYRHHPQHREAFRAVSMAGQLLSLPMGDALTDAEADRVIEAVRRFF